MKKNDNICKVINSNIITFLLHFFSRYFYFCIDTFDIQKYRYVSIFIDNITITVSWQINASVNQRSYFSLLLANICFCYPRRITIRVTSALLRFSHIPRATLQRLQHLCWLVTIDGHPTHGSSLMLVRPSWNFLYHLYSVLQSTVNFLCASFNMAWIWALFLPSTVSIWIYAHCSSTKIQSNALFSVSFQIFGIFPFNKTHYYLISTYS